MRSAEAENAELRARILRMWERFDALSERMAQAYADAPFDEGVAEIDAAVAAGRMHVATHENLASEDGSMQAGGA